MSTFSNIDPAVVAIAAASCGWTKTVAIKEDGTLDWFGETGYPTDQQILDAIPAAQSKLDALNAMGYSHDGAYKQLRAAAYPSIPDQLDLLYHQGYDGWKAAIDAVKQEYPKP